jgi:hypothetical protein
VCYLLTGAVSVETGAGAGAIAGADKVLDIDMPGGVLGATGAGAWLA